MKNLRGASNTINSSFFKKVESQITGAEKKMQGKNS
jgi:hypothetical protein